MKEFALIEDYYYNAKVENAIEAQMLILYHLSYAVKKNEGHTKNYIRQNLFYLTRLPHSPLLLKEQNNT